MREIIHETAAIEAAIRHPDFSHGRRGDGCWRGLTWLYHRDPASPSGVRLVLGAEHATVEPLLRAIRRDSPLSPAERS
jgi:hypothetical protein